MTDVRSTDEDGDLVPTPFETLLNTILEEFDPGGYCTDRQLEAWANRLLAAAKEYSAWIHETA